MRILLIIPAYNEEESILDTINMIESFKRTDDTHDFQLDYVVINDGSTDRTGDVLKENKVNAVHLISNLGIGGAVQTGYLYAVKYDYDIAVQFDGDGQHDISSIYALVEPIVSEKADFVVGSRFVENAISEFQTSNMRQLGIKIISFFIKLVTGKRIYDVTSGYRAANRTVMRYFSESYPQKYPEPESLVKLHKKNYVIKEVPVNMFEREKGVSSITPLKSVRYMIEVCSAILILGFTKEVK